jgi:hypothetical protein
MNQARTPSKVTGARNERPAMGISMRGSCSCNNIEVVWHTVDLSVVPRACQCEYCLAKGAAYVSKSGTAVEVLIHKERLHSTVAHGSGTARFHECGNCGDLVFVTAQIDSEIYGALNALCMKNRLGFPAPVSTNFTSQTFEKKRERWRQNWCHPVTIKSLAGEVPAAPLTDI